MQNTTLINLLTKLTSAMLGATKKDNGSTAQNTQKPTYSTVNGTKTQAQRPSIGGDFSAQSNNFVSPKQSAIDMLNRHSQISKRIDKNNE